MIDPFEKQSKKKAASPLFAPVSLETEPPEAEPRIKNYDFRKPKKFTREHLRDLNTVNENITRIFASNLSSMLRVFCEVNLNRLEERRYGEYINDLPDKTLIGLLDFTPSAAKLGSTTLILHVPPTVNFFLIDILLGGPGDGHALPRGYTEIETEILKFVYGKLTGYVQEAWNALLETDCHIASFESNPRIAQILPPDDTVVVMSFEIKMRNISDTISLCISAIVLDTILNSAAVSGKYGKSNQRADTAREQLRRDAIYQALSNSDLEVKAILGGLQLDTQEIINLQVSDIIPLGRKADSDIYVTVDDIPWFTAKLGQQKIRKAIKICDILPEDESRQMKW